MPLRRSRLQFSLRTIFVVVTLAAVMLAWRFNGTGEGPAIAAVRSAGGTVYFNYQSPIETTFIISVGMMPDEIYFSQVHIGVNGATEPLPPTVWQRVLGTETDDKVAVVEISLDKLTPELAGHLKSLQHLRRIILSMPWGTIQKDSAEAVRLHALQEEFSGMVVPAYNPD